MLTSLRKAAPSLMRAQARYASSGKVTQVIGAVVDVQLKVVYQNLNDEARKRHTFST